MLGQKITELRTINSMYANGLIEVEFDNGKDIEVGRIHIDEISKMLNEFRFDVEQKKKYKHLTNPQLIEEIK